MHESVSENIVCKMAALFFRGILVNIVLGNDLMQSGTKPLPKLMTMIYVWSYVMSLGNSLLTYPYGLVMN